MIQVGDAIWQGPQWCSLVQRAVRPVRIVEVLVLPQHHHQVAEVPDQDPVQQLTSAAANPSLHDRIVVGIPGRPDRRPDPRGRQLGAVPDRQVLAAGVAMVISPATFTPCRAR